jgi:hypothetical protein
LFFRNGKPQLPGTCAERFYCIAGWEETGCKANAEIRFEMNLVYGRKQATHVATAPFRQNE